MAIGESFPEVLGAAQLGAEWAWRRLYRDLSPAVIGYLRLQGVLEPEDVAGEAFVQVVRGLSGFTGDEKQFRSWVFVIAHHRAVDDRRFRARKSLEPASSESIERNGPIGNVEDEALNRVYVAEMKELLDALSIDQREVLLLRIVGGLTVEETAAVVGKRPSAVKALQRRGLGALRRNGMVQSAGSTRALAADLR